MKRARSRREMAALDYARYADLGRRDHLDVDARGAQGGEHLCRVGRRVVDTGADDADLGEAGRDVEIARAQLGQQVAQELLGRWQVRLGDDEREVSGAIVADV